MHFSTALCGLVATLVCMSSASPVPADCPHTLGFKPVTDPSVLTVGTFLFVPLKASDGTTEKVGNKNSHPAVILGEADADGRYPIAYSSHDFTKRISLNPAVQGVGEYITLKPGWQSSAAMVNMYMPDDYTNRKATAEEVAEMQKVWNQDVFAMATTGEPDCPHTLGLEPVTDPSVLKVGTFVFVPLKGADGQTERVAGNNRHPAVILGEKNAEGLYPIAYASHNEDYTVVIPLVPKVEGVGDSITLKPGKKSSAVIANMYQYIPNTSRRATEKEVEEMKIVREMVGMATTGEPDYPHILQFIQVTDPAVLTVGTFVFVPADAAEGTPAKVNNRNSHPAVILGDPDAKGRYPIAYSSNSFSERINLNPEVEGVGQYITLKPGWKSMAVMVNMYQPDNYKSREATAEEVAEMQKVRDRNVFAMATTGEPDYPHILKFIQVTDPSVLTVGTFVFVPLNAADGTTAKVGNKNSHPAVILGEADADGRYPIAYSSNSFSERINLNPAVEGVGEYITLDPGWKSSAVMVNMYQPDNYKSREATAEEVEKMQKVRGQDVFAMATIGEAFGKQALLVPETHQVLQQLISAWLWIGSGFNMQMVSDQ